MDSSKNKEHQQVFLVFAKILLQKDINNVNNQKDYSERTNGDVKNTFLIHVIIYFSIFCSLSHMYYAGDKQKTTFSSGFKCLFYSGTFKASTILIFRFFLATSQETKNETPNIKTTGITNVIQPNISIISYSEANAFIKT